LLRGKSALNVSSLPITDDIQQYVVATGEEYSLVKITKISIAASK